VAIDGELAFVGGIDMTDDAGDRFDTQEHQARRELGWDDVATRLPGPAVADVAEHFRMRWRELTGVQLRRLRAGERPSHRLLELPGVSRRSRRLLGPLSGLIDDG
jgi:phosphatidylserine/phosphatidylglycerophosphate/cardiolipin synthase-like enzyme